MKATSLSGTVGGALVGSGYGDRLSPTARVPAGTVALRVMGAPLRRTANLDWERSSLILSRGMVISPAMSLLKTMESPTPRRTVPVSWSPLVKTMTSGAGAAGAWAVAMAGSIGRHRIVDRTIRRFAAEAKRSGRIPLRRENKALRLLQRFCGMNKRRFL